MSLLTIGKTYQIYTKYETLYNLKLKVIGILTFEEASKVPYNMNVLAINEKVISVSDEDLESLLSTQNIYHLKSVTPNIDGIYNEYIIWDNIIDKERTSQINLEYNYNLKILLTLNATTSITQIISAIENFVQNTYGSTITFSIENKTAEMDIVDGTTNELESLSEKIDKAELVINALNKLNNTLVPAAEKLSTFDLASTIDSINQELVSINSSISAISNAIR